jgi:hypothetical protein
VYDIWVHALYLHQVIRDGERRRNREDEVVRDEGGKVNETMHANDTRQGTKYD